MANNSDEEQVNYQKFPIGFKFIPADEELITFYLRKKISKEALPFQIYEVDISEYSPIQLIAMLPLIGKDEWFFFTHRNKKYDGGTRPDRKSGNGFWRASTGYTPIKTNEEKGNVIGYKRLLKFFIGGHNKGDSTQWNMFEYTIDNKGIGGISDCALCKMYCCSYKPRKRKAASNKDGDESTSVNEGLSSVATYDRNQSTKLNNGTIIIDQPTIPANVYAGHNCLLSQGVGCSCSATFEHQPYLEESHHQINHMELDNGTVESTTDIHEGQDCLLRGTSKQNDHDPLYLEVGSSETFEITFDWDEIDEKMNALCE